MGHLTHIKTLPTYLAAILLTAWAWRVLLCVCERLLLIIFFFFFPVEWQDSWVRTRKVWDAETTYTEYARTARWNKPETTENGDWIQPAKCYYCKYTCPTMPGVLGLECAYSQDILQTSFK